MLPFSQMQEKMSPKGLSSVVVGSSILIHEHELLEKLVTLILEPAGTCILETFSARFHEE